ncbi:hypothetical protein [Grimontia marina]|uniref:Uncharacterized protein n=1 Tax=Grimontia marina TaxID=646534 RepID=A0A128FGT1_9GAMM|nr:hypothetical protein [Grimontia marina]CZF85705.1 hypothetical protein GMA8713_03738 [Grimontia marina]
MLWHKVQNQLELHDISFIVGPNRSDKTKFLVEQYGDMHFAIDISKATLAYCGGDTTITDAEWQQIVQRDYPFITVDDAHLLNTTDLLKLIEVAVETKKRLYMSCNETIVSDLPALLTHARKHCLSVVKLERLTANDVCAWVLGEFG